MRFHCFMDAQPPTPTRDPRDAWRLVRERLSRRPTLASCNLTRAREDLYPRAAGLWKWTGVVCFCSLIVADMARAHDIGELREAGTFSAMFMAMAAVIVFAWKREDAGRSQWMGIAAGLSVSAGAIAELDHLHIAWQGRVLGYAFLLFAAAHFGPKIRDMTDRAPEPLVARVKWYVGVLSQGVLTLLIVTSAWALAMPTGLGGDAAHPPDRGLVISAVWPAAVLALLLIGWPAAKRLLRGGLSPIAVDWERRLLLTRVLGTLGLGLLFTASGVRGAVVGPSQPHPASAELAAAILIWLGFWVERRLLRKVVGARL
jgi:hypothetical protein